jgi:hypothetical protein
MKKAQLGFTPIELSDSSHFNIHYDAIKDKFLAGDYVRIIDYPESQRHQVIGAIAILRDQLPIVTGWQTLRQSYLSETRTRARHYYIPEAFLRDGGVL